VEAVRHAATAAERPNAAEQVADDEPPLPGSAWCRAAIWAFCSSPDLYSQRRSHTLVVRSKLVCSSFKRRVSQEERGNARRHAVHLAQLLKSKVISYNRETRGDPAATEFLSTPRISGLRCCYRTRILFSQVNIAVAGVSQSRSARALSSRIRPWG